ncbi:unnamed protein product [Cochlearia groenlandica]
MGTEGEMVRTGIGTEETITTEKKGNNNQKLDSEERARRDSARHMWATAVFGNTTAAIAASEKAAAAETTKPSIPGERELREMTSRRLAAKELAAGGGAVPADLAATKVPTAEDTNQQPEMHVAVDQVDEFPKNGSDVGLSLPKNHKPIGPHRRNNPLANAAPLGAVCAPVERAA